MEKFGSISRLVAELPEEDKKYILEDMRGIFNDQSLINDDILSREKEKTSEHEKMIALADQLTNELLQKYGLPDFQVPVDNVHLIDQAKWWTDKKKKYSGFYLNEAQGIAIQYTDFKLECFRRIVHEMVHMKSYNAMHLKRGFGDDTEVSVYRSGLETFGRDIKSRQSHLRFVNEAVTESLAIEVFSKAKTDTIFSDQLVDSAKLKHELPAHDVHENPDIYYVRNEILDRNVQEADEDQDYSHTLRSFEVYSYQMERKFFNILIDKIMIHHPEYQDRQEVFDLFAQGVLQGNMMPLARVIEGTFGRGTFRSLGECSNLKKIKKLVKSLK